MTDDRDYAALGVVAGRRFSNRDLRDAELGRARHALARARPWTGSAGRRTLPTAFVKSADFGRELPDLGIHGIVNKKLVTVTAA